jgi:predicted molibdopterin-dependent oxidoreductase YjgC
MDDLHILTALAKKLGKDWGAPTAHDVWEEVRRLSPWHGGMSYERLEALNGLQWPCPTDDHPGSPTLHTRLWSDPVEGERAGFQVVHHSPPVDMLSEDFPLRLTTGRRLESFNTGVMTGGYTSPLRYGERIEVSPEDAVRMDLHEGELVRVVSRRGAIEAPIKIDPGLREGLTFMTMHFPDEVETNILTIDAVDPKSGTAEFKAAAIRIEKIGVPEPVGAGGGR